MAFHKQWSIHEDDYLRRNYQTLGADVCSEVLRKPKRLIWRRAHNLHVTREYTLPILDRIIIPKPPLPPPPAVLETDFIRPPSMAKLMAGK